jgi:hypothetical protein
MNGTMLKKTVLGLLIISVCGLLVFCRNAETESPDGGKESSGMFDLKGVQYPVRFANFQRNSLSTVAPRAASKVAWSKGWNEINPAMQIIPFDLLVRDGYLGVRAGSVLLVLDERGNFLRSAGLGENTPVVFGAKAVARLGQSYLLDYVDYEGNPLLEMREFPAMGDFTRLLLMRPAEDDFLAVTHFTGGPRRDTPHFDVYRIMIDKTERLWSWGGDGGVDAALLTPDEKTLVVIRDNGVTVFDAKDGKIVSEFPTGLAGPVSTSLDPGGNLVMAGADAGGAPVLKKTSLDGAEKWSFRLVSPKGYQPPACGPGDRVYLVDGFRIVCVEAGKQVWEKTLPGAHPLLTVGKDGTLVVLCGGEVVTIGADGEIASRIVLTETSETFEAAPAIGPDGRIYAAGSERIYCVE